MFKNYFLVAFRNLKRQKGYSLLNIFGLAIGMTACILILMYVRYELSYDKFHNDLDRVHRVVINFIRSDGSKQIGFASVAPPYGKHMRDHFPEIESVARFLDADDILLKHGEKNYVEDDFFFTEAEILNVLTIPLVKGDLQTALDNPQDMVISQSMAKKIFGDEDPIGKELAVEGLYPYIISAVMEDLPSNSHIHFNFFIQLQELRTIVGEDYYSNVIYNDNFGNNLLGTYIKLYPGVDAVAFDLKIRRFIDELIEGWTDDEGNSHLASDRRQLALQNVGDIHLTSKQNKEYEPVGDIRYIKLFALIAAFILLIACINFMNLATARSANRAREVGLRKVIGANRGMLLYQFLSESLIISTIALLLAILLTQLTTPIFANFVGKDLSFNLFQNGFLIAFMISILFLVGIVAGAYPAFYLSSFRPSHILRGELTKGKKGAALRKVLVVFQFIISASLIVCVSVVFSQINYMSHKDLGFDKENMLIIQTDNVIKNNWPVVKKEMLKIPGVLNATASKRIPSGQLNDWWGWSAEVNGETISNQFRLPNHRVDYNFFETYGMDVVAGRAFREDIATDDESAVMLSEMAVQKIGWASPQEAVGSSFSIGNTKCTVIGIANDIHFESLRNEKLPLVYYVSLANANQLALRLAPGDIPETISRVKTVWDDFHEGGSADMSYSFLDDKLANNYENDTKLLTLFGMFSGLAILISCLGLIGLSAFTAEKRTREIGIRKVLGATVSNILTLLGSEFTKMVVLGSLIALPIAWYAMKLWLESFAYRINMNVGHFLLAVGITLAIAVVTVITQTLRAASMNPTDALKRE